MDSEMSDLEKHQKIYDLTGIEPESWGDSDNCPFYCESELWNMLPEDIKKGICNEDDPYPIKNSIYTGRLADTLLDTVLESIERDIISVKDGRLKTEVEHILDDLDFMLEADLIGVVPGAPINHLFFKSDRYRDFVETLRKLFKEIGKELTK